MHHWVANKNNEKEEKYLILAREQKKAMEHENNGDTNCSRCTRNDHQNLIMELKKWKSAYEQKPSKLQHYWDGPEYWEESLRQEEEFRRWITQSLEKIDNFIYGYYKKVFAKTEKEWSPW